MHFVIDYVKQGLEEPSEPAQVKDTNSSKSKTRPDASNLVLEFYL
jgi:hypothetical protein